MIVPFLFFCSGATALIYEVVWSKYLALIFGSTIQAQTVVLAVFMGGLALGNRAFGHRADATPRPLFLYGALEVCIGLIAFFFDHLYSLADATFIAVGQGHLENRPLLLILKATLSVAMLLPPTLLMGGTLPLLASWLQRGFDDGSRWSARFYSINSLGAVSGSFIAGFFLVRNLGLVSTLQLTALLNVLVGFAAIAISRSQGEPPPIAARPAPAPTSTPATSDPSPAPAPSRRSALDWGCLTVAITGGTSMGLEVLASRSLVLIFGASLQAFAVVLMAFILGIGIGGAIIASPRWKRLSAPTGSSALLLGASVLVGLLVLGIEQWAAAYLSAKSGIAETEVGFRYHQVLTAAFSMVILGIPAALLGSVLPLWIRAAGSDQQALGGHVGRLLTWNTVGAVVGVLLTGFVLMPALGLRGAFITLVLALCTAGIVSASRSRQFPLVVGSAVFALLMVVAWASGGETWRQVLGSGVFRLRGAKADPSVLESRRKHIKLLFYEDAPDATVAIEQVVGVPGNETIALRINGKVDASSTLDLSTQYLLAHVPLLAKPNAKDVFVLGLGSGVTAGALLSHSVDRVVIAENCEPVVRAAKFFSPWNNGVLTNRTAVFVNEDARTVLKLSDQSYDVIISEPSNPWMAGIGSVFSREFYEIAARRLKPGGVMAQWFHVYEMNDGIVAMVLRSFASVFPHLELWDPGSGDIILLGSKTPWKSDLEAFSKIFEREATRKELATIGILSPEALWARQLASQATAAALVDRGPIQSDFFPVLEYEAPRAFFIGASSHLFAAFDERTWQSELAPPEKNQTLQALPLDQLKSVFTRYNSVNAYLNRFLTFRFQTNRESSDVLVGRRLMPCVFRPPSALLKPAAHDAETNTVLRALDTTEWSMRSGALSPRDGVSSLLAALKAFKAVNDPELTAAVASFAPVAARTAIAHQGWALARQAIDRGLELQPDYPELRYLSRILDRRSGPSSTNPASGP